MAAKDTGPLDWRTPIVDGGGRPSPQFQRAWNTQRNNNALIGAIVFGSGAPTGTPEDGAFYIDTAATPYALYIGKGGAWNAVSGTVTTTGTPASGALAVFSGAKSITNGDLTGPVTTSGGTATTLTPTGVTAGSYTSADITVGADGRVTAASDGSGGGGLFSYVPIAIPTAASIGFVNGTVPASQSGGVFINGAATWTNSVPTTPYSITALSLGLPNNPGASVGFTDGTKGIFIFISTDSKIHVQTDSNISTSTFNSTLYTSSVLASSSMWLKIRNDGTSYYMSASTDGLNWVQVWTQTLAASYLGATGFKYIMSGAGTVGLLASWQQGT